MGARGQNLGYDRDVSRFRGLHRGPQARKPRADDYYVMFKDHSKNTSMRLTASSIGIRHFVRIDNAVEVIGRNIAEP